MKIFDISVPISSSLPVWPGDPPIIVKKIKSIDVGDSNNSSYVSMGVHSGTHIDAPHHFLNNNQTVDDIDLGILIGDAFVVSIPKGCKEITDQVLEQANIPNKTERLIIKTTNSSLWEGKEIFSKDFVALDVSGANWLVDHKIKLVGIDYLSIAPYKKGGPTHNVLLKAGIAIIEGLNLAKIEKGNYELICLPLKIMDSDGAPARVALRSHNHLPIIQAEV